jgi:glycosyltransferase involved in cell wall biosynthesis
MLKPIAIISVINDLVSDQRIDRSAITLQKAGYIVLLVGRKRSKSPPLLPRDYDTHRMRLLFEKGPLFYLEYNFRLFIFLAFKKPTLLLSNDLDTLLPNFVIHKLKRCKLIYDAHEYFTGVPELVDRPWNRRVWKTLEKWIVPRLKFMITVNDSIGRLYKTEYGITPIIIRNVPFKNNANIDDKGLKRSKIELEEWKKLTKKALKLPEDKALIILQGAGININRGAEEAVMAMHYTKGVILLIVGEGDVIDFLKALVRRLELEEKVCFIARQPYQMLYTYTAIAEFGISFDKDTNINYRYSLPNKLFDYINAGIPVMATPLPEIKKIIELYQCGTFIERHEPKHIADCFMRLLNDKEQLWVYRENAIKAAKQLDGEKELKVLFDLAYICNIENSAI